MVVLSPEVQEILFSLGVGNRIVGNTEYCDYPEEAKNITKVGDFRNPDIEKIILLKPDIIFLTDFVQRNIVSSLKRLKLNYVVIYSKDINELLKNIEYIGKIFKKESAADNIIQDIQDRLRNLKKIENKPIVLPVLWIKPVYTAGNKTLVNDVIEKAGGKNLLKKYKDNYFTVDSEFLLSHKIDYILICDKSINTNDRLIKNIKKNNKDCKLIYNISPDLILRASPRTIHGIEKLNTIFYERTLSKK